MGNMSVFDKLQNYSSIKPKRRSIVNEVLDTTTPQGAFLAQVHNAGYKIYNSLEWVRKDNANIVVPQDVYDTFEDSTKENYRPRVKEYSELYYALTTKGNQEINAIAGSGKALVNGTKIFTSVGYKSIETLQIGDKVFGLEGKLYNVKGVYPQGLHKVYTVKFSDGTSIDCNKDHLWTLDNGEIYTTEQLMSKENVSLPIIEPLQFSNEKVPINPYLLGVLYNCGFIENDTVMIKISDKSILKNITIDYTISELDEEKDTYTILFDRNLNLFCKNLNLLCNKSDFVLPYDYKMANIEDRLSLLVGLIDTNGAIVDNKYTISIESIAFAQDIIFIAESLGLFAKLIQKNNKYYVLISLTSNFNRLHTTTRLGSIYNEERKIVNIIEQNKEVEMTCIEIESPSHLYLTEHCIPTHNTTALIFKVMHDIVTGEAMIQRETDSVPTVNKMWVCTFLKSGATELSEKLAYWQKKFGYIPKHNQVVFSTLDAEFKRCLNAMGVKTPIDSDKASKLLKETIDDLGIRRNGEPLRQEDYSIIESIVTYYRGRLTNKYTHPSAIDYGLNGKLMDLLVQQFADKRRIASIMDFDEMSEILYQYLYVTPNPNVQDFVANRYNYIYIDEFQDTSQLAYAILKFYARGKLAINNGKKQVLTDNTKENLEDKEVEFNGLVTNEGTLGKVVVIGDTSQCLVKDTVIETDKGNKYISEIVKGDKVRSAIGKGKVNYVFVDSVLKKKWCDSIIHIKTERGKELCMTPTHKLYVKAVDKTESLSLVQFNGKFKNGFYESTLYNNCVNYADKKYVDTNIDKLEDIAFKLQNSIVRKAELIENCIYTVTIASKLKISDIICIYDNNSIIEDRIVDITRENYNDYVYDINIGSTRNFVANGIISHNCIYSFRGSDSTILAVEFAKDFAPTKCALSYNWRCPSNILNPIVPCIHMNTFSKNQVIQASKEGGEFFAYDFATYKAMVDQMQKDIEKDLNDGLSVAILVRTNYDGAVPAFVLATDDKYDFSLSGNSMTLNTALPRKLLKMTSLFTEKTTPTVLSCLLDICSYIDRFAVRNMIATLKGSNKGIWEVPLADIHYSCPSLEPFVTYIESLYFTDGKKDKKKEMLALRGLYVWLHDRVYSGNSTYAESARAYIETILYILDSAEFEFVYDFIEEMDFIGTKLSGKVGKEKAPITIATVHESKGKEYDSVYVWNVIDGQFPSNKTNLNNINELEEERRIFYIACTRAKVREHLYTVQSRHSMFLDEMDITLSNPIKPSVSLKN